MALILKIAWILFGFHGRLSRRDFALGAIVFIGVSMGSIKALEAYMPMSPKEDIVALDVFVFTWFGLYIISIWGIAALWIKRLHDLNYSSAWFGVYAGSIIGLELMEVSLLALLGEWAFTLFLLVTKGTPGPNRFGENSVSRRGIGTFWPHHTRPATVPGSKGSTL